MSPVRQLEILAIKNMKKQYNVLKTMETKNEIIKTMPLNYNFYNKKVVMMMINYLNWDRFKDVMLLSLAKLANAETAVAVKRDFRVP